MRSVLRQGISLGMFAFGTILGAETVTLPVAASVVGQAPFVSDVRVFNTSYDDPVTVTATYRCTPGSPGCGTQPVKVFQLGVRESRAFDDIVGSFFVVPNSLGAVEFDSSSSDVVVTSRLYSPASSPPWPSGTVGSVGMFIPGLDSSSAHAVSVLTNLANGLGLTGTFRTNVGVYNPNGGAVTATIRVYESGSVLLGSTSVNLGGKTGTQLSNIYQVVGFGSLATSNGYATVESDNPANPLFTYAATADNVTQDPVLVVGVEDKPAPAGFHAATPTPSGGSGSTGTPTPTPTPSGSSTRIVNVGPNGTTSFIDTTSGSGSTMIHVGDTVQWVWKSGPHSTTSGTCTSGGYYGGSSCDSDGTWDSGLNSGSFTFSHKFTTAGTFKYFCGMHLGSMTGTVVVQ